MDPEELILLNF